MSNTKIGIVGLPNVGKSTLFKALTKRAVACENYPFCTIDPNIGVVEVQDKRLSSLALISQSEKIVSTTIEFMDIAGLVKGAHKGDGLGNQFLAHIKEVDAIAHIVRIFHSLDVCHVDGTVDPKRDIETINTELAMHDLTLIEKHIKELEKKKGTEAKEAHQILIMLQKIKTELDKGLSAKNADLTEEEFALIKKIGLLTIKPVIYIFNTGDIINQNIANQMTNLIPPQSVIYLNLQIEADLREVATGELSDYMREFGLKESGLDKFIHASYQLLNLITFFTSGKKETRGWILTKGQTAQEAAGKIHSDIERGFIRAETIECNAFVEAGGWTASRDRGLIRIEGKEYQIQDGDVCYFRFAI